MGQAYKRYFKKAVESHFPDKAKRLIKENEERFLVLSGSTAFAAKSSNPIDRRLDFSAYFLAFIQTLENDEQTFDQIRNLCLEITYDYVTPKTGFLAWLKRLPPKLIDTGVAALLLKVFNRKVSKLGHPDGFRAKIITDKAQTYNLGYGIDILECGICKLFASNNGGKYASILCEVDKVTSGLAGLELIRNGTIANGAEKCDFRFRRLGKS